MRCRSASLCPQIEDAAGRRSNVLEDWLIVYVQPPSAPEPCS